MKKFFASLFFLAFIFISVSHAADIGDVALRFCNNTGSLDEKTLALTTSGQEEKDICMTLINRGNEEINVTLGFVDGTVTNDADQKKACKNDNEIENFGQYITLENKTITVAPKGTTTVNAKLNLPEEAAGEIHGCVVSFVESKKEQKEMFAIKVRRANFIDVFAKGVVTIGLEFIDIDNTKESLSNNPKIISSFDSDEKTLYIQSILKNKGTAEQGVTIKGEIKNRLGYKKTFFEEKRTLFAKQESAINSAITDLPFYKGPYTITLNVEHNANIQEGLQTDNGEKKGTLKETTSILVITKETYISLVGLLAIISGLIILLKRKKGSKQKRNYKKNKTTPIKKKTSKSTKKTTTKKVIKKKK